MARYAPRAGIQLPVQAAPSAAQSSVYAAEEDIEAGVAHTARWTAAMRFIEQEQANPLFSDPLARVFAGELAIEKWREEMTKLYNGQPNGKSHIAIRARALDDLLTAELEGMMPAAVVQVVSLGAGMCTRAWRLSSPGPRVVYFEVDRPDSMRLKEKIASKQSIKPSVSSYCTVGVDFENPNASLTRSLLERGFDPQVPTIFMMEGLLCYLTQEDMDKLAKELDSLVKARVRLVMTVINDGFYRELKAPSLAVQQNYPGTTQVGQLFFSSWEDGCQVAFEGSGWSLVSIISREDYAKQNLGCDMLMYTFPDRRTSTEFIIVMRRRIEGSFSMADCGRELLRSALFGE